MCRRSARLIKNLNNHSALIYKLFRIAIIYHVHASLMQIICLQRLNEDV
jgi:hypothetical protein